MSLEKSLPTNPLYKTWKIDELGELLTESYPKLLKVKDFSKAKVSFAPSQMFYGSGICPRLWYYKFQGGWKVVPKFDAVGVFNMETGTASHHRLQNLFEAAGIQVEREQTIHLDYPPVNGFMDSMFEWNGEMIPVEVKTAKQEGFYHKQAEGEGAWYQVMQLLLYMHILKKKIGFLFYENRNNGEWLIFPIEMTVENQQIVDNMIEWMKNVWDNKELPTRPFTQKSKECKDCPFVDHCWSDEIGTVTIPVLDVPVNEKM